MPELQEPKREGGAEERRLQSRSFGERLDQPSHTAVAAASLASPPPIQPMANMRRSAPARRRRRPGADRSRPATPRRRPSGTKTTTSASDTRLEIVMVKRSREAAKTISARKDDQRHRLEHERTCRGELDASREFTAALTALNGKRRPRTWQADRSSARPVVCGVVPRAVEIELNLALSFVPMRGHDRDDDDGDEAGDQAVFDGGGAGLVGDEAVQEVLHGRMPFLRGRTQERPIWKPRRMNRP